MKLAFGNSVSPEFRAKVLRICRGFGWSDEHASWLMACMAFESAGTFSPSIKNAAGSGATGLIQFMPRTAIGLGTTVDALAAMDAVEQLDWVARYFKPYAKRVNSLPDMYMAILLPKAVGFDDSAQLFTGGTSYRQNAGLDADNDGIITKAEATGRVTATLWKGMQPPNVYEEKDMPLTSIAGSVLASALPSLIAKLPEIAKIFKNPDVAERNVEAVSKVGEILISATGSTNMQEAVERVQADPKTASEVNDALRNNRADLMDVLEREAKMREESVGAAREFGLREKPVYKNWHFNHILALLIVFVAAVLSGVVMFFSTDPGERTMVLNTWLVIGLAGVIYFWYGSSRGSQMKDEARQ